MPLSPCSDNQGALINALFLPKERKMGTRTTSIIYWIMEVGGVTLHLSLIPDNAPELYY